MAGISIGNSANAPEAGAALTFTRRLSARQLSEYENCMRLSAEGKISAKNAFALNLIDYLEGLVKDNCEFSNFQLASSSLDAGAKIYAGRVDAVHREAYKVMAELGRSGTAAAGDEGDNSDCEAAAAASSDLADSDQPPPKRSRSSASTNQQQHRRLGRKSIDPARLARIRLKPSSLRFDLDPLFHQQAAVYDESAAWELRLNAARVADNNCEIVLDSDASLGLDKPDDSGSLSSSFATVDCGLFSKHLSRVSAIGKLELPLCQQFSQLKLPTVSTNANNSTLPSNTDDASDANCLLDADDDDDWQVSFDAESDGFAASSTSAATAVSPTALVADFADQLRQLLGGLELGGQADPDLPASNTARLLRLGAWWPGSACEQQRRCLLKPTPAGAAARALPDQAEQPVKVERQSQIRRRRSAWETAARRRQRRLNEAYTADALMTASVNDALSSAPVAVRRSRRLAGQHVDDQEPKMAPKDVREDLESAESGVLPDEAAADPDESDDVPDDSLTEIVSSSTVDAEAAASAMLSDASVGGESSSAAAAASSADSLFADGLLEPPYKVARFDLEYARTAKRVDAKRLKRAMWQLMERRCHDDKESPDSSTVQSSSFAQLLEQLPELPAAVGACSGGELSVQLVFNCLLHLAGEQNLRLESKPDLSDVSFSQECDPTTYSRSSE